VWLLLYSCVIIVRLLCNYFDSCVISMLLLCYYCVLIMIIVCVLHA